MALSITNPLRTRVDEFVFVPSSINDVYFFKLKTLALKNPQKVIVSKGLTGDPNTISISISYIDFESPKFPLAPSVQAIENPYGGVATSIGTLTFNTNDGFFIDRIANKFIKRERISREPGLYLFFHTNNIARFTLGGPTKITYVTLINGGKDFIDQFQSTELYLSNTFLTSADKIAYDQRMLATFLLKADTYLYASIANTREYRNRSYQFTTRVTYDDTTYDDIVKSSKGMKNFDALFSFDICPKTLQMAIGSIKTVVSIECFIEDSSNLGTKLATKTINVEGEIDPRNLYFVYENNKGGFESIIARGNQMTKFKISKSITKTASAYRHENNTSSSLIENGLYKTESGEFEYFNKSSDIAKTGFTGYFPKSEINKWIEFFDSDNIYLQYNDFLLPVNVKLQTEEVYERDNYLYGYKFTYEFLFDSSIPSQLITI